MIGSVSRVLAQHTQSSRFDPQNCIKTGKYLQSQHLGGEAMRIRSSRPGSTYSLKFYVEHSRPDYDPCHFFE